MKINGIDISKKLLNEIRLDVKQTIKEKKKKPPKLLVISVGHSGENFQYIKNKQKAAESIGALFEHRHYNKSPRFESFIRTIAEASQNPEITGLIVQRPLPANLASETLVTYMDPNKEIEGFAKKSLHTPPIGLAVLTVLKYVYTPSDRDIITNCIVDIKKDIQYIKSVLKRKKIVLIGRGETGGAPVGKSLSDLKINYINLNSSTPNPEGFLKEADIIISAVGKKVITPENIKQGAILMSIGLHHDGTSWVGDYDENEIEPIASFYTPTPGGIGPLNIAYLMHNLVKAWRSEEE